MASKPKREELRDTVRSRGLRSTPSRLAVLDLVSTAEQPVSHSEVTGRLGAHGWNPATLYRNLMDLAEVGLLRRTDVGDHVWRFEVVNGKHNAKQHPHFVCTECGVIECLPAMSFVAPRAKTPRSVRQRQIEVHVRGLCDGCG